MEGLCPLPQFLIYFRKHTARVKILEFFIVMLSQFLQFILFPQFSGHQPHMNAVQKIKLLLFSILSQTPWQGAQTMLYCALSHELEPETSEAPPPPLYYKDCAPAEASPNATDERVSRLLWEASERYTGLFTGESGTVVPADKS